MHFYFTIYNAEMVSIFGTPDPMSFQRSVRVGNSKTDDGGKVN